MIQSPPKPVDGSKFYDQKLEGFQYLSKAVVSGSLLLQRLIPNGQEWIQSSINRYHPNAASKKEIIQKAIDEAKRIGLPSAFLLQYPGSFSDEVAQERKLLRTLLASNNMPYIDSYEYVHGGKKQKTITNSLWTGHHTKEGNDQVYLSILESDFFTF